MITVAVYPAERWLRLGCAWRNAQSPGPSEAHAVVALSRVRPLSESLSLVAGTVPVGRELPTRTRHPCARGRSSRPEARSVTN